MNKISIIVKSAFSNNHMHMRLILQIFPEWMKYFNNSRN